MSSNLQKIDHIVVLMLENRSFDNVLGWLGASDEGGQKINGVAGKNLTNPIPEYVRPPDGTDSVPVGVGDRDHMTYPNPDPGEEYAHINTQLFGTILPEENRFNAHNPKPPYNLPAEPPAAPPMNGFVTDYVDLLYATSGIMPEYQHYKTIMDCFPEDAVPVLSKLAREYAVFDAWFASVPSQTLCNRSFMHAATSHGYVLNSPFIHWMLHDAPTIFNRLAEKNISWRVYFDKLDILSLAGLQNPALWKYHNSNFKHMEDFYKHAADGTLPSYAFIEPRFFMDHNDQHPPVGKKFFTTSSVLSGEQLLKCIYEALKNGPHWEKTLFIITFDEHGGCYDHVSPPAAIPPDPNKPKGEQDFQFDRLGIRVPTVMISPYIKQGTVISDVHDHTSIIKTICDRWSLEPLTERDRHATNFENVLNLESPDRRDGFLLEARPYRPSRAKLDEPLTDLQKTVLYLLAGVEDVLRIIDDKHIMHKMEAGMKIIPDEARVSRIKTVGQAIHYTLDIDRRVTKHLSFWGWLKMKIKLIFRMF